MFTEGLLSARNTEDEFPTLSPPLLTRISSVFLSLLRGSQRQLGSDTLIAESREQWPREVKGLDQGHTAGKCQPWHLNLGLSSEQVLFFFFLMSLILNRLLDPGVEVLAVGKGPV